MSLNITPARRRLLALSSLVSLGLLTACGGGVSGGSGSSTSGSGGAGSTSTGSSSSAEKGVTGTALDTFDPGKDPSKAATEKQSFALVEALVDDGGKYSTYKGSAAEDGTIQIPDVPAGPYWLVVSDSPELGSLKDPPAQLVASDAHTVDLGHEYSYRSDISHMVKNTTLVIDATFSLPWEAFKVGPNGYVPGTSLSLYSRGADFGAGFPPQVADSVPGLPADGATSASGVKFDLGQWTRTDTLVRGDEGDDFTMLTVRGKNVESGSTSPEPDPWATYYMETAVEAATPDAPVTMNDGASIPISVKFKALPEEKLALDYRGSLFNKLLDDLPYQDWARMSVGADVYVEHLDQSAKHRLEGNKLNLLSFGTSARPKLKDPGCSSDDHPDGCPYDLILPGDYKADIAYGANMLGSGQEYVDLNVEFSHYLSAALPGSTFHFTGGYRLHAPVAEVSGAPIQPLVSFVRNVKVGGKAAPSDTITKGVGLAPQITFDPPSTGKPNAYKIEIAAVTKEDTGDMPFYDTQAVADLWFPGTMTSVRLPEGLLKADTQYVVFVTAYVAKDLDLAAPFKQSATEASAEMFTGVVVP